MDVNEQLITVKIEGIAFGGDGVGRGTPSELDVALSAHGAADARERGWTRCGQPR